jgi:hypothetical protein
LLAQAAQSNEFFTVESLATLAGASFAATVVANVVGSFFRDQAPKRTAMLTAALVTSFLVSISLLLLFGPDHISGSDWLVASLNGVLIFSTATGINQLASGGAAGGGGVTNAWF